MTQDSGVFSGEWTPSRWAMLAAAVALGLLAAFVHVVQQGVHQGMQRRGAEAAHQHLVWQCQSMPQRQLRLDCMQTLPGNAPVRVATTGPMT